jgi:hypothetical protein
MKTMITILTLAQFGFGIADCGISFFVIESSGPLGY